MSPEPVEFAPSRGWNTLFLMGALGFVGAGLWLLLRREADVRTRLIGLGNALFFGLCAWTGVREDGRPRPRLRLDASGIEMRHPFPGASFRFEWRAVASVSVRPEERTSFVVLTLRAPTGVEAESIPDSMAARGFTPAMLRSEVTLSPLALGVSADVLVFEIERFRRFYGDALTPIRREDMM